MNKIQNKNGQNNGIANTKSTGNKLNLKLLK